MPFPFGPSRKSVERIGGWLGKYAKDRLADMRSPSDLPRALLNPDAPGSREQLMQQAMAMVGSIGPSGRVGNAAKKMLQVEHYSAKPGLRTLDPKFAGSGRVGAEAKRTTRTPATHLYDTKARRVEQEFARDYRYTAEVPADRIYDVSEDAAGIVSRLSKKGTAPVDGSRLERAIQKEGYMGYRSSFDAPETLKIFEKLDVTPAAPRKLRGQTFGAAHPEPSVGALAKSLLSTIQNNRAGFSVRMGPSGLVPATKGYAVGAGGVNKNTLTIPLDKLDLKQLAAWMKANPAAWRKGLLGGWVDDAGNAVIEPSTPVSSLARATKLGVKRGEQAIGDLAKYARGEDGTISLR